MAMSWWLIIAAIVAAALVYGYWEHGKDSRHLARLFAPLAAKYGGEVTSASFLALPQLRFETGGRRFLVAAMATSGDVVAGSSGYSGPFTFVDLDLPFETGQRLRIERSTALDRGADVLIDAVTPGRHPSTGHAEFDAAFRIRGRDHAFASRLLDARVRRMLLDSRLPRLDIRVEGRKISVHGDGIAKSKADLDELIEIAVLLADRLPDEPVNGRGGRP